MELEALGGSSGQVLDIGCGFGDNAIYTFDVADATPPTSAGLDLTRGLDVEVSRSLPANTLREHERCRLKFYLRSGPVWCRS